MMLHCCPLCESSELKFHTQFPDKQNQLVEVLVCNQCLSFVPQYVTSAVPDAIAQQTKFHEAWWKGSTTEELQKTLDDLHSVVKSLHAYLGEPAPGNLIVEIGCGRGSLLRALVDAGYQACGCEPASGLVELARTHYSLQPSVLHEMPAEEFINSVLPTLPAAPSTIFLWHVLEHIERPLPLLRRLREVLADNGRLVLQLPLLSQEYVYPEHYFFVTHESFHFLSNELGMEVDAVEYDADNLFVTVHLKKCLPECSADQVSFLQFDKLPSGLGQGMLLRDQVNQALRLVIADRDNTIGALTRLVDEKISSVDAQASLIEDKIEGMRKMEQMIQDRDASLNAQACLLEEKAQAAEEMKAALQQLREAIINNERIIQEQDVAINEHKLRISSLAAELKDTSKSLEYYENSRFVKVARKIRILG